MSVDPIMLERGVVDRDSRNIPTHHGQWNYNQGPPPMQATPWGVRERSSIGVNRYSPVPTTPADAAAAYATPRGILKKDPYYESMVSTEPVPVIDDPTITTDAALKKVTWDTNVKKEQKPTFDRLNQAVIDNLKGLAIGLDNNVQNMKEKMQCGNIAAAKDFYCPSNNGQIVMPCGRCANAMDGCSLGTNSLLDDGQELSKYRVATISTEEESYGMMEDDQYMECHEYANQEYEDRYNGYHNENGENHAPVASISRKSAKKKNRGTLTEAGSSLNHYARPANRISLSIKRAPKTPKGARVNSTKKFLQSDESYISALTDPTTMPKPKKKSSKKGKEKEKVRYTTRQPEKKKKKTLKRVLVKPIKVVAAGLKIGTRKLLTSKAH